LFIVIRTMTLLSCCTKRVRPKLQWPRRLNLRILLWPDHVFLHGHHQLYSLLLVHTIQGPWAFPRCPQLPSQAPLLPSLWRSLQWVVRVPLLRHTCRGKGHFKRDCPNAKVWLLNQETNDTTRNMLTNDHFILTDDALVINLWPFHTKWS
jgi:hypothetical protein